MIRVTVISSLVAAVRAAAGAFPDGMVDLATEWAAIVAGLIAVGWFYMKVLKPLAQLIVRALKAWDVLEDLPETLSEIRCGQTAQQAQMEDRLATVEVEVAEVKQTVEELTEPLLGLAREFGVGHRGRS